jgi:hypothetical protein
MKSRINKIQNALKQIKPQKVGAILTVLLFGAICAIGGYELRSSTDGASSPLPVSKGGTGGNNFPANSVLVGNGPLSFSSRGIDTTPQSGSNNLITSDALYQGSPAVDVPIAPRGDWNFANLSSKRIGKTCFLIFRVYNSTTPVNAGSSQLFADTTCKPPTQVFVSAVLPLTSGATFSNLMLTISDSGVMSVRNYSTINIALGTYFAGSVSYLAAD